MALLLMGLVLGGANPLQAQGQVDCSAMEFVGANASVMLVDLPTTPACQNPTFLINIREEGTGAPYVAPPNVSIFTSNGSSLALITGLAPCTSYDIRVFVYCGTNIVGVCTSQGGYQTTGCETPTCDGVMAYNISNVDARISVTGFENCREGQHLFFQTQWRPVGSGAWTTENSQTTAAYKHLENLQPCTEYEYRIRVSCDGDYLPWCTGTFKTGGCPCDDCGPAVISIASTSGPGCSQSFTVSASLASSCSIASYDFDFGDGNTATSSTNSFTWNYSQSGSYEVCVTVNALNPSGDTCSITYCDSIEVTDCLDCDACGIDLKKLEILTPQFDPCTKIVVVQAEVDGPCSVVDYTFSWGDGQSIYSPSSTTNNTGLAGHRYPREGLYELCVRVRVDNGNGDICEETVCQLVYASNCDGKDGASKTELKESLYAYPNPVSVGGEVMVVLPEGGAKLHLVDLEGRTLQQMSVTTGGGHRMEIPGDLATGIYLLMDEEGRFEPQRILVQ